MNQHTVALTLNQQQLELLERTIGKGVAPDLTGLVQLALREYAAKREQPTAAPINLGQPA